MLTLPNSRITILGKQINKIINIYSESKQKDYGKFINSPLKPCHKKQCTVNFTVELDIS